ncbi:c-type cytochrome [Alishewanella sp. d11]|uniref:c-type cytochrome n=1 Tax=Alishewanella sp. d11 TaxID=3414030 RepID=UPI003BF7FF21
MQYSPEQQQLLQQGSQRARSCAACHGPQGISRQALYPSLAGQPAEQLAQALREYRDGTRKNALMSPQARGLTEADIELLAAFYALLPAPKPKQE